MANPWEYKRKIKKLFWRAAREGIVLNNDEGVDFRDFYERSMDELEVLFPGPWYFFIRLWLADVKTWTAYFESATTQNFPYPRPTEMPEDVLLAVKMGNLDLEGSGHESSDERDEPRDRTSKQSKPKASKTPAKDKQKPEASKTPAKEQQKAKPLQEEEAPLSSGVTPQLDDLDRQMLDNIAEELARKIFLRQSKAREASKSSSYADVAQNGGKGEDISTEKTTGAASGNKKTGPGSEAKPVYFNNMKGGRGNTLSPYIDVRKQLLLMLKQIGNGMPQFSAISYLEGAANAFREPLRVVPGAWFHLKLKGFPHAKGGYVVYAEPANYNDDIEDANLKRLQQMHQCLQKWCRSYLVHDKKAVNFDLFFKKWYEETFPELGEIFILSLGRPFPEFRTMSNANDRLDRNTLEHSNSPLEGNTTQDVLETDETEKDGDEHAASADAGASELSAAGPSKGTKRKYAEEGMGEGEKKDDAKKQ